MAFSQVPNESKNQINKAGKILVQNDASSDKYQWAREIAEKWRACHAYPINTFQATLRVKLKNFSGNPIAAQRLKRMPTIIDKLKRYPAMQLTTMQDIGGVRAILNKVTEVYRLADEFRNSRRLTHILIDEKDYIQEPRNEDGYRSLHLIYKYKNKRAPEYDGLKLELQIRTKLQHTWATAVETMGTFLGQALKSRQGDREWLDFFAIVSAAFAQKEKRIIVPRFSHLSPKEIAQAVASAEANLQAIEKMRGFSAAAQTIVRSKSPGESWFYHLIILDSLSKTITINTYNRDGFNIALMDYGKFEAMAAKGVKIEPVLVSAGPIANLRRAYPNFFLDISDFAKKVSQIIAEAEKGKQ